MCISIRDLLTYDNWLKTDEMSEKELFMQKVSCYCWTCIE